MIRHLATIDRRHARPVEVTGLRTIMRDSLLRATMAALVVGVGYWAFLQWYAVLTPYRLPAGTVVVFYGAATGGA